LMVTMSSQAVGTARTYAFIGFIFYVLSTAAALIGILVFAFFFAISISTAVTPGTPTSTAYIFPFFWIPLFFFILLIPGIILSVLAWTTVRNIDLGRYDQARTYSLILGIIGLFFGFLSGIFFLLAYAKLSELTTHPAIVQPLPQRFCTNCGRGVSTDAKFCSHCGKELPP